MKKYTLITLMLLLLTLSACGEQTDLFDSNFKNRENNTKEEVINELHHFSELAVEYTPDYTIDTDYNIEIAVPLVSYNNGTQFDKSDFEDATDALGPNRLEINALVIFIWLLDDIYILLDECEFEEGQTCELGSYTKKGVTITIEQNRMEIEYFVTRDVADNKRIRINHIYLTEIEDELYVETEEYNYDTDRDIVQSTKYIFYENNFSKGYAEYIIENNLDSFLTVIDLNDNLNYFIGINNSMSTIQRVGQYNIENNTFYHKQMGDEEKIILDIYEDNQNIFSYSSNEDILLTYNLLHVNNWDYIELDNNEFHLYKNDQTINENIRIAIDRYGPWLYRDLSGTPSDGQIALNDVGLEFDITMDEINSLIDEDEVKTNELLETLNIQTTYEENLILLREGFTFTYTDEAVIDLLQDKTESSK